MLKYLKHYIPAFTAVVYFVYLTKGHSPTLFLTGFSAFLIVGDYLLPRDTKVQEFSYPSFLNLSIYINLPILFGLVLFVASVFSGDLSLWQNALFESFLSTDFVHANNSLNVLDKISLVVQTSLLIGALGTVPGHELTHRVASKFDMFMGNWLLAFSCDCTFAIEHVYGHHKNACFPEDPASAAREEKIYPFISKAIFNEHMDGWRIEKNRLEKIGTKSLSAHNRMIIGYLRSLILAILVFVVSGWGGVLCFMICALGAKVFLEAINYIEHYGLVREKGKRIHMRHSWNSNHFLSSIYLCNVTRHSDHHRLARLKFWELHPCPENAPMTPYGYLSMLYLSLIFPYQYRKVMSKRLLEWDLNYANTEERKLANPE
jgi:alkane 1-monooxygenase